MITCITYADQKFRDAARFTLETAKERGADNTILYGPEDVSFKFKAKNWRIYCRRTGKRLKKRGDGYWIWKPYIIKDALNKVNDGDYVLYSDATALYVNDISSLLSVFDSEKLDYMVFTLDLREKLFTKRDAFIILDADKPEYTDTLQHIGGYLVFRKCAKTMEFVNEWLKCCCDYRLITDAPNVKGRSNYPEFLDHRHDQSIISLLAKKHGMKEYRDPSQFGNKTKEWDVDILERSTYPQIWYSTRNPNIKCYEDLKREKIDIYHIDSYVDQLGLEEFKQ